MEANNAQIDNLVSLLDGYAGKGGHHLNVNVLNCETLPGCPEAPGKISPADDPCIRLCRKLHCLTPEQQADVISPYVP